MSGPARVAWLDVARGLAVVAMIVFHLIWDLAHFGYVAPRLPWSPPVKLFGHAIAFSFLFIAGYSLALAHRDRIRWPAFWRRLGVIAAAAALVSVGTYVAFPDAYVFFGILHVIAAASLAAAPFLRAPWALTAAAGLAALAAPRLWTAPLFDAPALIWIGLGTHEPLTQDWRPFLPWAGALLLGVAAGQWEPARRRSDAPAAPARGLLHFLGRHSLLIYLAHQPALFALFTGLSLLGPARVEVSDFGSACETTCVAEGGAPGACRALCACVAAGAAQDAALAGATDDEARSRRIRQLAARCAAAP